PKEVDFFKRAMALGLKNAKLAAFGSTRKASVDVDSDPFIQSLLSAGTDVVVLFGKSWDLHVTEVLRTTHEENLLMIADSVGFFKQRGKEVIFDAEHFFDGYKANAAYALSALKAAADAGADCLVLCDTCGGCMPLEVLEITKAVVSHFKDYPLAIGFHAHNDTGMGVANSIMAVDAGATHVQGTINGIGERCGNANLCTIIPNLQLKKGLSCIPEAQLETLTESARYIAEIANISVDDNAPYVGNSAFAHKAGMHIDGVKKNAKAFEHVNPPSVGNQTRFLMSEMAGRAGVLSKIQEVAPQLTKDSTETAKIIDRLRALEHEGYQFEAAEGSIELIIQKELGMFSSYFELEHFKTIVSEPSGDNESASAIIKIRVGDQTEISAAEGDGPVNALDKALRKALVRFYPNLTHMYLTDFKVRVLDSAFATAAKVRVLIESTDGKNKWSTVGVSTDIIDASWKALLDSVEYKLQKDNATNYK
ncbi:MAG: citramalate synthase, partial [Hyphomonadaceae bacterium]|nr:citramalate synthase [Clostridia bacterium]